MSARSFRSVFMVASCAGAALGCYLVSLRVASERAALEDVETKIVLAQRDLRLLQTEIGTRGRLAQLERWNVKVLALSAPSADQFLNGGFELAKMTAPQHKVDLEAPVVLASAPAGMPRPHIEGVESPAEPATEDLSASRIMHVASLKRETARELSTPIASLKPSKAPAKPAVESAPVVKAPVVKTPVVKAPVVKAATAKAPAVKPVTTAKAKAIAGPAKKPSLAPLKVAQSDPLAPLEAAAKPKTVASSTSKDTANKQ